MATDVVGTGIQELISNVNGPIFLKMNLVAFGVMCQMIKMSVNCSQRLDVSHYKLGKSYSWKPTNSWHIMGLSSAHDSSLNLEVILGIEEVVRGENELSVLDRELSRG